MKLFYSSGSCSLAPHIVMAELNMMYELEAVNLKDKTSVSGDYRLINPKGAVPALRMENGEILTEGAIISQYLADQKNDGTMLGKFGTTERYRTLEWLNFVATEIHKNFSPLFGADRMFKTVDTQTEVRAAFKAVLNDKIKFVSEKLGNNDFLTGKQFTIADAYMFTCLNWSKHVGLDLSAYSNVNSFMNRVSERPAVMRAMKEQGMTK
ncbi:MAG: glutathione transferase GstA [Bdellovibrionales bacterium]|nr:glutathione transferase GstA [Bdellovibrionales bacterium]